MLFFLFPFFCNGSFFCQYSMPLLMYFYFFCVCGLVLLIFYVSSFFCFFCVCGFVVPTFYVSLDVLIHLQPVAQFCKRSMPLYYIFSFLLCLCLGFANALCIFICVLFFSFVSVALFCQCSMSLYYIFFFVSVS